MAWIELPGVKGKIYEPDPTPASQKKHPCKDCYECQMCSDARCAICRSDRCCAKEDSGES